MCIKVHLCRVFCGLACGVVLTVCTCRGGGGGEGGVGHRRQNGWENKILYEEK